MTQALEDAVLDTGLTPGLIVRLTCEHHDRMRLAVSKKPEQCPHCSGPVLCEILAKGGTRRVVCKPEANFAPNEYVETPSCSRRRVISPSDESYAHSLGIRLDS